MSSGIHMRHHPPLLFQYLRSFEEVEGQLPEQGVHGIFDQSGEPGPIRVVRKRAPSIQSEGLDFSLCGRNRNRGNTSLAFRSYPVFPPAILV